MFQERIELCEDGYELYVQDSCVGKLICDVNKVSFERAKQKANGQVRVDMNSMKNGIWIVKKIDGN